MTREEKAARRGARYLDKTLPGWAAKIDLRTLDMDSPEHCVIGQTVGDYYKGMDAFGHPDAADEHWVFDHGFNLRFSHKWTKADEHRAYDRLVCAWAPLIALRLVKAASEQRAGDRVMRRAAQREG